MHYWADIVADIFGIHILPAALVEIVQPSFLYGILINVNMAVSIGPRLLVPKADDMAKFMEQGTFILFFKKYQNLL